MNAVLYAAGRGLRLGDQGRDIPKVLLRFNQRSLLERHLQNLADNHVSHLTIVSGYAHERLAAELDRLRPKFPLDIDQLVNPDFTEGSVLSFQTSLPALQTLQTPVLLMDADVLYPAGMLRRLIDSKHPTALLIDRDFSTADDDPVLVPISHGRPFDFRKQWTGNAELLGESIGFFKVAPPDIPLLIQETLQRTVGEHRKDSYDDVLRALVRAGRFGHEDVTGIPWTEIDFPDDIQRAEREILPAMEKWADTPTRP